MALAVIGCAGYNQAAVSTPGSHDQASSYKHGNDGPYFHFFAGPAENYRHQMTLGPDGNVWFRDTNAKSLGYVTPKGAVTEFALPEGNAVAAGIAGGPDGNIWYTEAYSQTIGRVTLTGSTTLFRLPYARVPFDITAGADGNLWFTAQKPTKNWWWIGKITPAGAMTFFAVPGANADLNDITLGPDGNVWFADGGSKVVGRITPSGAISEFAVPAGLSPNGIVRAADGNLYSAVNGGSGALLKITQSGKVSLIIDTTNASQFGVIAEGPQHCIWGNRTCSDGIGECLDLFNVTHKNFVEYPFTGSVSALAGLVAGADGDIWFQLHGAGKIADGLGKLNVYY